MNNIERSQLYRYLAERQTRRLIVIYGKAGQGKSMLLKEFSAQNGLQPACHYCLSEETDTSLLLKNLANSLAQHDTRFRELQEPASIASLGDWSNIFRHKIRLLDSSFYLMLDNYHLIDPSAAVRTLLNSWLAEFPDTFHLILLTRSNLMLPVSRYRCSGNLVEIHDGDLAWNAAEVTEYFHKAIDLVLPEDQVARIIEISEGWPTALLFLAEKIEMLHMEEQKQSITNFINNRSLPALDDFFSQELLPDLDSRELEALMRLSAFTSASAELVAHVLGAENVQLLESLSRRFYFLRTVDTSLKIFTLHPLFASYLFSKFTSLPAEMQASVHKLAAEHFLRIDHREQALQHLVLAGEIEQALEIFSELADAMLELHEIDNLNDLLYSFPEEIRDHSPLLLYYSAITSNLMRPLDSRRTLRRLLARFQAQGDNQREANIYSVLLKNHIFYQGNREAVAELITLAQDFIQRSEDTLNPERKEVLGSLISLSRWWTTPDLDEAYEIALRAEEISYQTKNREVLIFSRLALSRIYLDRGDFQQARGVLEQTERLLVMYPDCRQYEALLRFYLGDTFFYLGELDRALHQVEQGLEKTSTAFMFRKYLLLNQVLYLLYLPDTATAETILNGLAEENSWGSLYARYYSVYLTQMLLAYRQGNRERTAYFCRRLIDPENRSLMATDYPYSYLAVSEVLTFLKQYDQAVKILERLLLEAPEEKFPYPTATAHGLLGYIRQQQQEKAKSREHFETLRDLLITREYRNLDICSSELIKRIGVASGIPEFKSFPRLSTPGLHPEIGLGLYLCTLGEFKIYLNEKEIAPSVLDRQKKVMDLLKLLIVYRDRGIVKEVLYDLFWPGYQQKSARDNLNTILYRLRKILGTEERCILTSTAGIRLDRGQCSVDADQFLHKLAQGELAMQEGNNRGAYDLFSQAKSLYRGDFLEKDLYYDDIRDAREALRNKYFQLLFQICRMSFDGADYYQALELAKELIHRDPLCEPGYRLLMIACTLIGNRSEIPRLFDKLNTRLQRYYGIGADPRTGRLKELLLSGKTPEPSLWQQEVLI